mgnify:CR=1 FL=1
MFFKLLLSAEAEVRSENKIPATAGRLTSAFGQKRPLTAQGKLEDGAALGVRLTLYRLRLVKAVGA